MSSVIREDTIFPSLCSGKTFLSIYSFKNNENDQAYIVQYRIQLLLLNMYSITVHEHDTVVQENPYRKALGRRLCMENLFKYPSKDILA